MNVQEIINAIYALDRRVKALEAGLAAQKKGIEAIYGDLDKLEAFKADFEKLKGSLPEEPLDAVADEELEDDTGEAGSIG